MNLKFIKNISFFILLLIGGTGLYAQTAIPEKPELKYVTVDTSNNNVNIFWEKSVSPHIAGYIIYVEVYQAGCWQGQSLDTVAAATTSYTHIRNQQATGSALYSVTAIDSFNNQSLRKPEYCKTTGLHTTIYNTIKYDSCSNTILLSWNKYQGWGNNVSGYHVYQKEGTGTFSIIAGLNANDSTYLVYNIEKNRQYYFFIEAVKNDNLLSLSNISSKYTFMPLPPAVLNLDYVSVENESGVNLQFSFTENSGISDFAVLRSLQEFSEFDPISTFHNIQSSPSVVSDEILTSKNTYFYRIAALNTCGFVISESNLGTNILLEGKNADGIIVLTWNEYRDFTNGTGKYEVYRYDNDGSPTLIAEVNENTYSDNLSSLLGLNHSGKITYRVKAIENSSSNAANSNLCDVRITSDVWMPNAFTPNGDGKNDVFLPRLNVIPDEFLMLIYDRAGIVIFKSTDPETGWDGRINGKNFAPEGVYVYHVQLSSFTNQKVTKTGHVTVFYPK